MFKKKGKKNHQEDWDLNLSANTNRSAPLLSTLILSAQPQLFVYVGTFSNSMCSYGPLIIKKNEAMQWTHNYVSLLVYPSHISQFPYVLYMHVPMYVTFQIVTKLTSHNPCVVLNSQKVTNNNKGYIYHQ